MGLIATTRRLVDRRPEAPDHGLPVPPRFLRFSVAGTDDRAWFLQSGRAGAESLRELLGSVGRPAETLDAMLDFGCGCGRVIRHFADLKNADIHGTDLNARAVEWCNRNLAFGTFARNRISPPTGYADGTFDFVYALSVFTHLPEALQFTWIRELRRIVRPRGLLALTTHGASFLEKFSLRERRLFEKSELAVCRSRAAGSNRCAALHPEKWVRERLAVDFDVIEFIPEGARGNPTQDLYLLRAR